MISYVGNDYFWAEKEQSVLDIIAQIKKEEWELLEYELKDMILAYAEKPLEEIDKIVKPLNISSKVLSCIMNSIIYKYKN